MNKKEVAAVLNEIAVLLELGGENPFKVRAYQNGARLLDSLEGDLETLLAEKRLEKTRGIGAALAKKIETLHRAGTLPLYEELKGSTPPGFLDMLQIPGLGPKKIKKLHERLEIDSIEKLTAACEKNQVAELPGFGTKSQEKILTGIRHREAYGKRRLWIEAFRMAEPILEGLRKLPEVRQAETAGSLRRRLETVGDLDFLAASEKPGPVMDWFTGRPDVTEVIAKGETKSSARIRGGLQADLRVVPREQFCFALHYFTGSKAHNIQTRRRALEQGWSLNEYGLTPRNEETPRNPPAIQTEEDLYKFLGLQHIPPELREGREELDAAAEGKLPVLVQNKDIRGVLHNHTTASDGACTLEEMAQAAEDLGWEYLGIADHSKSSRQANGLDGERLLKQAENIRRLNASRRFKTRLLAGVECDILNKGKLDCEDAVLEQLDYVVVAAHAGFGQNEKEMTNRIIKALEHPRANILAHPAGRLLLRREPYAVNLEKVIDAAIANRAAIEINADPLRLDLDWRYWKRASEKGLLCAINPDAHDTAALSNYALGVQTARKGWLTKDNILNTRPLPRLLEFL